MTDTTDLGPRTQIVNGVQFVLTCISSPEQYDARIDGVQVAYVRLRFGRLTTEMPDVGGHLVYRHEWPDPEDNYKGDFDTDAERSEHLAGIADVITARLLGQRLGTDT